MISREHFEEVEAVEAQLDAFIEKRAREAADQERVEELWAESARRDRQRRREENRLTWREFHLHLACNHAALCDRHRQRAAELAAPEGVA